MVSVVITITAIIAIVIIRIVFLLIILTASSRYIRVIFSLLRPSKSPFRLML